MSEKIRAVKVQLMVPKEVAVGDAVAGRAMIFAKYACGIDEPAITSTTERSADTVVVIEESAYDVRRRSGKKRTE